jgi:hypothetical protein
MPITPEGGVLSLAVIGTIALVQGILMQVFGNFKEPLIKRLRNLHEWTCFGLGLVIAAVVLFFLKV